MNSIPTTSTVPTETRPTKRARGRPKKSNQQNSNSINNGTNTPMASNSHANVSVINANSLRDLNELRRYRTRGIVEKGRPTTVIHRMKSV